MVVFGVLFSQILSILGMFQFTDSALVPNHDMIRAAELETVLQMDSKSFTNVTNCGGAIATKTGAIYYKLDQPILPNERCAWIIRPDPSKMVNVTGYTIGVFSMGFESIVKQHHIKLSSYHSGGWRHETLNHNGLYHITGNIIVITLAVGKINSNATKTGINIQYSANQNGDANLASNGSIVFSNDINSYLRHQNTKGEISAFLYQPNAGVENELVTKTIKLTILEMEECIGNGLGPVHFLKFNGATWDMHKRFCNQTEPDYVSSSDLIFILFYSDMAIGNYSFALESAQCSAF